jgi:hypothetical protein
MVKTGRMQWQKKGGTTTTKTMSQDNTDTNDEGTDDNNGDQGMKTNGEEFNEDNQQWQGRRQRWRWTMTTTWHRQQQCMMRGTTSMGQEQKVLATDTELYDEEHKKGPKKHWQHLLGHRPVFLVHFIFLLLTKFLDINYGRWLLSSAESREGHHGGVYP